MKECPTCGTYMYDNMPGHICAPLFKCYRPDHTDADEAENVYSWGEPKHAAEDYCEKNFSRWEYPHCNIEVNVICPDGTEKKFIVEIQPVPEFTVRERIE